MPSHTACPTPPHRKRRPDCPLPPYTHYPHHIHIPTSNAPAHPHTLHARTPTPKAQARPPPSPTCPTHPQIAQTITPSHPNPQAPHTPTPRAYTRPPPHPHDIHAPTSKAPDHPHHPKHLFPARPHDICSSPTQASPATASIETASGQPDPLPPTAQDHGSHVSSHHATARRLRRN